MPSQDYYLEGAWNFRCQECGRKYKSVDGLYRWDHLWVCPECYEERNPQDFIRPIPDNPSVPWSTGDNPRMALDVPVIPGTNCGHRFPPHGWSSLIGGSLLDGFLMVGSSPAITNILLQLNGDAILQLNGDYILVQ